MRGHHPRRRVARRARLLLATTLYVEVGRFKRTLSLARPLARRSLVASASRYAVNTDKPQVETLDIYRTNRPNAPVFVFIHGGAWLGGLAKNNGFAVELFDNAGVHYVALDLIAIKEADGDLRRMADQVRRGIAWVYENAGSFGGDRDRLYVGGFSSGGHLCGVSLVTDWQKDFGLPPDFIKGGLCMSGMYDLEPVQLSKRSEYVKFADEMEQAMSSHRQIYRLRAPLIITYGRTTPRNFSAKHATSPRL